MSTIIISVLVVVVLIAGARLIGRARRRPDGVDSFRRQIDALSPDSRRPTIDQMKPPEEAPDDDEDDADGT